METIGIGNTKQGIEDSKEIKLERLEMVRGNER